MLETITTIDPFLMQLVIIPFITIGCGVLSYIFFKKVWLAPLVTFMINALVELYYFYHYYGQIELTSWCIILPIISLLISLTIKLIQSAKPSVT